MASTRGDQLDAAGGAEQVADHALGAADGELVGVLAEDLLDGLGLGHVAQSVLVPWALMYSMSSGLMRASLQGQLHGLGGAAALGMRGGDVVGVGGAAVAEQFGIDAGAALLGVLEFFEDEDAGALAQDEAVAVLVERPAGRLAGRRCAARGPARR